MKLNNPNAGLIFRSNVFKLLVFIFAFPFLIFSSPQPVFAQSCISDTNPQSYIENYLKSQQNKTFTDVVQVATELVNIKISEHISLGNAIGAIQVINETVGCFQNRDYITGLNTIGTFAAKTSLQTIAQAIAGSNFVTLPANVVELGIEAFRNQVDKASTNNIIKNFIYAQDLRRGGCKGTIDECTQRIIECSNLSVQVHDTFVCYDSDGFQFTDGWLIMPRPNEEQYFNPGAPDRTAFYKSAEGIYKQIKQNDIVKQNQLVADGLIGKALVNLNNTSVTKTTPPQPVSQPNILQKLIVKGLSVLVENTMKQELIKEMGALKEQKKEMIKAVESLREAFKKAPKEAWNGMEEAGKKSAAKDNLSPEFADALIKEGMGSNVGNDISPEFSNALMREITKEAKKSSELKSISPELLDAVIKEGMRSDTGNNLSPEFLDAITKEAMKKAMEQVKKSLF